MVLDGGGHFSPADIVRVHTSSLLLLSHTAHDRAEGNTREHKRRDTRITTERGYSTSLRQGGMNSVPL